MPIAVEVSGTPLAVTIRRDGHRLLGPIVPRVRDGRIGDQFIQPTEGVVAQETLGDPIAGAAEIEVTQPRADHVVIELRAATVDGLRRLALAWPGHPEQRLSGLGARHGLHVDQATRDVTLGADRRYTGPDCPPDMLDLGGIPQGDYAPVPWLLSSRGWAAWLETDGPGARFVLGDEIELSARQAAGPLRVHLFLWGDPPCGRALARLADGTEVRWTRGEWSATAENVRFAAR